MDVCVSEQQVVVSLFLFQINKKKTTPRIFTETLRFSFHIVNIIHFIGNFYRSTKILNMQIENLISVFSYFQSLALWTSVDKITSFQIIV